MSQHFTSGKMEFGIGSGWQRGIRPGHPGIGSGSGIMKHGALRQELIAPPQRVFHCTLHAKQQFPFATADVHPLVCLIGPGEYRFVLRRGVRNGKADGNPAGHKSESGENPHRPDDSRRVENFLAGSLMNEGCDFAPEVGANHGSDALVLQHDEPVLRNYRFIVLENERVRAVICPDLGGKVTSLIHKGSGKEVLYTSAVIRPVRILPRFAFVAGGIAVSFPISHSPTQNEPVLSRTDQTDKRVYVSCGERELRFGMQWTVEYSLGEGDEFRTQRAVFHNPGTAAYPWMSWSNAALPSAPDTEFHFPRGEVLRHGSKLATIDWQQSGPRRESDITEMTGYFWKTKDANAFGAFTASLGTGLYHIADQAIAPGMKLWSYGVGKDRVWATLSSARDAPYVEIQGGPMRDQSIKLELQPQEA